MIRRITGKLLSSLSWLPAAYLGYWAVQLVESGAATLAARVAGVSLFWRVTPWQWQSSPLGRGDGNFDLLVRIQWPFAIAADLVFLTGVWYLLRRPSGGQGASNVLRSCFLFGGLWVAINRAWQLVRFGFGGTGRPLRQLLDSFPDTNQAVLFPSALLALAVVFVVLGVRVVQSLHGPEGQESAVSFERRALTALPLTLGAAMQTAIWAAAQSPQRAFRTSTPAWALAGPMLVALVLILIALWRRPWRVILAPTPGHAVLALAAALTLAAGLASAERIRVWQGEQTLASLQTPHYEVLYDPQHWSRSEAEAFASERESKFAAFEKHLPWPKDAVRLRIVVYPGSLALLRRGPMRGFSSFQLDGTTARVAADAGGPSLSPAEDARLYLAGVWGPSKSSLVGTWVARWVIGEWQGRSLTAWAARLRAEGERLSLADLVEESRRSALPPSQGEALGGAWVQQLAEGSQLSRMHQLYSLLPEGASLNDAAQPLHTSTVELEENWDEWVKQAAPQEETKLAPRSLDSRFLQGMSLKPTELPSQVVQRELPRLQLLGSNAIAIVTHEHYRGGGRIQYHANTESNDERLIRAIRTAQGLGMQVLLKPHVYDGGEGFAGNICIEDPAERAIWMQSYSKLIRHYARIAQDEGVALFSVGNELGCLTKHEADWRKLITDVRHVYSGPLTYAANWGEEFETLRFWDALDFVGLNNYYPLTQSPGQGLPEMLAQGRVLAEKIETIQRRWQRPVLFTEVGYPSVKGGTFRPWAPPNRQPDAAEQAAGYEAILRTFAGKPWLRGIFWWAWYDGDFSPAGKPAEQTLRTWYRDHAE
jgi:hypothetical protein